MLFLSAKAVQSLQNKFSVCFVIWCCTAELQPCTRVESLSLASAFLSKCMFSCTCVHCWLKKVWGVAWPTCCQHHLKPGLLRFFLAVRTPEIQKKAKLKGYFNRVRMHSFIAAIPRGSVVPSSQVYMRDSWKRLPAERFWSVRQDLDAATTTCQLHILVDTDSMGGLQGLILTRYCCRTSRGVIRQTEFLYCVEPHSAFRMC